MSVHLYTLWNLILELNMVPGVLLEPYMSQGDQGVAETPIVSKGLRSGWAGTLKMKKCQKWSGNDEFWPKNEYCQISSSFGQHALNPFDTKPMAKIAVKMSIMSIIHVQLR